MAEKPYIATLCARCAKCGSEIARCDTPVIDAEDQDDAKKALVENLGEMKKNGDLVWELAEGSSKIHLVAIEEHPEAGEGSDEPEVGVPEFDDDDEGDSTVLVLIPDESGGEAPGPPVRQSTRSDD